MSFSSGYAGGGNDYVFANHAFDAADQIDGGSGFDVVGLLGTYNVTLGASTLTNVEKLDAYSSGNVAAPNNYTLIMNDGNVAAGQQLFVTAASLRTGEHLNFDGSAETNGKFLIYGGHDSDTIVGGAGADRIIGGEGADTLTGGAGNDAFQFNLKTDSTPAARDTIIDFATGDKLDFYFFDANDNAGGSQHFTFIGTAAFSNVAGQLMVVDQGGGHWLVEGDTNGDGVADFSLAVTSDHALGLGDFNL
ncbi:MAG: calcium-binding protein [Novosphingobium sp.]